MLKRRASVAALLVCFLIIQFAMLLQPAQVEAAKVVKFVPTAVYNDRDGILTVTGQFQNIGDEYIAYVDNFVPVVYLDDIMYAADNFAFKVDIPPGYYREVYMKFNVVNVNFHKWYIKWDSFNAY